MKYIFRRCELLYIHEIFSRLRTFATRDLIDPFDRRFVLIDSLVRRRNSTSRQEVRRLSATSSAPGQVEGPSLSPVSPARTMPGFKVFIRRSSEEQVIAELQIANDSRCASGKCCTTALSAQVISIDQLKPRSVTLNVNYNLTSVAALSCHDYFRWSMRKALAEMSVQSRVVLKDLKKLLSAAVH